MGDEYMIRDFSLIPGASEMSLPLLKLRKNQDRRVRAGHPWIYSNEVDTAATPLKTLEPGCLVEVENAAGKWLGYAHANPHTLICARLLSRDRAHPPDRSLLVHRIKIALSGRSRLYADPYYRLVFGESDALPGLVVDRYGDVLVVQIGSAGMERMREALIAALDKVLKPSAILLRNDSPTRELEGLSRYIEPVKGEVPDRVVLSEGGARFEVSLFEGQKTGWFYDQAYNRDRMIRFIGDKRVLDVFSYVGAWGVRAAHAGAKRVTLVDASARAIDSALRNAELNGVESRVDALQGDAFEVLRVLRGQRQRFDVVIVDPPAFIKKRKDHKAGALAYQRINDAALRLLERDGVLISSSCSHHFPEEQLLDRVQRAARHSDRYVQLLLRGSQAPDHPVHPAVAETHYLKALYFRGLTGFW